MYSSSSSSPQSFPSYEYCLASTHRFVLARFTFGFKEMEFGDSGLPELEVGEELCNAGTTISYAHGP